MKARLSEIAEEVAATHERVRITKNGREYVVLAAADDLESMEATLELLAEPDAQDRVQEEARTVYVFDVDHRRGMRPALAGPVHGSGRAIQSRLFDNPLVRCGRFVASGDLSSWLANRRPVAPVWLAKELPAPWVPARGVDQER